VQGTQLIELFTSQGCSSCPPAEKWISQLATHKDLWKQFVPVVYHVDYWDRLGWKDPFARKNHTERQYHYSAFHQLQSVYTPGFFVDGREWRGFFQGRPLPSASPIASSISAHWEAGQLKVTSDVDSETAIFHAAILGFGLQTSVTRGENAGRKLGSNFVVLSHKTLSSKALAQPEATFIFQPQDLASEAPRYGFAVWVQQGENPVPLAAAGNWLPKRLFSTEP